MRTELTSNVDMLLSVGLGILMSKCSEGIIWLVQPLMIIKLHKNFYNHTLNKHFYLEFP